MIIFNNIDKFSEPKGDCYYLSRHNPKMNAKKFFFNMPVQLFNL